MVRLTLRHGDAQRVDAGAGVLAARLQQRFGERGLGRTPRRCPESTTNTSDRLTQKFERSLAPSQYRPLLQADLDEFSADARWKRLRVIVDVDPA